MIRSRNEERWMYETVRLWQYHKNHKEEDQGKYKFM